MTAYDTDPERAAPAASILATAATWPGVTTQVKPRGSTAILLLGTELGHVHLDRRTLDMSVGERRAQILSEGRANEWFSDWVSKPIDSDTDAADGLALLRESYDTRRARTATATPAAS